MGQLTVRLSHVEAVKQLARLYSIDFSGLGGGAVSYHKLVAD